MQLTKWFPKNTYFLRADAETLSPQFKDRSVGQIGRGSALLSAVVGSMFLGLARAAETATSDLGGRIERRAGEAPEALLDIPPKSVFPNTPFSLKISPRDYFLDTDSAGFKIEVVEKGKNTLPNWLHLDIEEIHFLGTYDTDNAYEVEVIGNLAYIADGESGLIIINVSNPSAPFFVGSFNTAGIASGVDVVGNFAYVADRDFGLQIIDVSNPSIPLLAGSFDTPGNSVGVVTVNNLAYVADLGSGLQIIDVSNPSSTNLVGSYNTPENTYVAVVVGNFAYIADGESGLQIIDVSNPTATNLVGSFNTLGVASGVDIVGNFAYVADGDFGLQIIEVSNPSVPHLVGSYDTPGRAYWVKVVDNLAYVADRDFGIQIIDVSNPSDPILAGSYDTPGSANEAEVVGNFLYITDFDSGLQVLELDLLLSGVPRTEDIGNYELELFAEDPDFNQASSFFLVHVEGPPSIAGTITNQLTKIGDPFSYFIDQAVFPDPNNDVVYYSAKITDQTDLPSWLSFSPIGIFSGTPQSSDSGIYDIQISAFDGIVSSSSDLTFSLTVDHFPQLSTPLMNHATDIDALYSFTMPPQTFTDKDIEDTLTYCATLANGDPLPAWLSFNPTNHQFSGTPTLSDAGSFSIKLTATDTPGAVASALFNLEVENFPSLQSPIPDQLIAIGIPYVYVLPGNTFIDIDGDPLTYRATKTDGGVLPAWLGFIGSRLEFQGTPQPSNKGLTSLKVVAEDPKGGAATSLFNLNIVDALSQEFARIGGSFVYQIPEMINLPQGIITHTVTLGDRSPLPAWLHHNPATNILTGLPPSNSEGVYNILVVADDSVLEPSLGVLSLTVGHNAAPKVVNPLSNEVAQVGQTFRLVVPDNTFADPNEDSLLLSASRVNGRTLPSWLTFSVRTLEGKPGPGDTGPFSDKTVPLQICATDSDQEACSVFDLSVQGTSNEERALSIFAPLFAIGGIAYGWFNKRGFLINPWNRKNYDKGFKNLAIGEQFSYKFEVPQNKTRLVKAFKGKKMFAGLPALKSLDQKGYLEWLKFDMPISSGSLLPDWLEFKVGYNLLKSEKGPDQVDAGLYTVRAYGDGEVILEEIRLKVGDQSESGTELTTRKRKTGNDPSSGMVPLLEDEDNA